MHEGDIAESQNDLDESAFKGIRLPASYFEFRVDSVSSQRSGTFNVQTL